MKKSLMILLLTFSLIACSDDSDSSKDGKKGGKDSPTDAIPGSLAGNSNKLNSCFAPTPLGISLDSNPWTLVQEKGEVQISQTLEFYSHSMTNHVTCTYFGESVKAQVHAPVEFKENRVSVLSTVSDQVNLQVNGETFVCNASLHPDQSFQYQFVGECLEIETQSGHLYFQSN